MSLEKRIVALEEKFSYQDELVSKLNLIVANQEIIIKDMVTQLKSLKDGDGSANADLTIDNLIDEIPPHY